MKQNATEGQAGNSVRMGPISLVSLVIIMSLAVMCVLSFTTARAMYSSSSRQANATDDIYACETAGQEFLAEVDAALAEVRGSGEPSKTAALAALGAKGDALIAGAAEVESANISAAVEVASDVSAEQAVSATFVTESDRRLSVTLAIDEDATYRILSWKTTTFWNNYSSDTLWSGTTD